MWIRVHAVGVGRARGARRQDVEPGEQAEARIEGVVPHVGVPLGAEQFERQEGQEVVAGGDDLTAWEARLSGDIQDPELRQERREQEETCGGRFELLAVEVGHGDGPRRLGHRRARHGQADRQPEAPGQFGEALLGEDPLDGAHADGDNNLMNARSNGRFCIGKTRASTKRQTAPKSSAASREASSCFWDSCPDHRTIDHLTHATQAHRKHTSTGRPRQRSCPRESRGRARPARHPCVRSRRLQWPGLSRVDRPGDRLPQLSEGTQGAPSVSGRSLQPAVVAGASARMAAPATTGRAARAIEARIARLEHRLTQAPAKVPVTSLPGRGRKRATLKSDRHDLVTGVKLATYNAERLLARRFFQHYQDPRDGLTIFRSLLHLPGVLRQEADGTIAVQLQAPDQPRIQRALVAFLADIDDLHPRMFGTGPALRFEVQDGQPRLKLKATIIHGVLRLAESCTIGTAARPLPRQRERSMLRLHRYDKMERDDETRRPPPYPHPPPSTRRPEWNRDMALCIAALATEEREPRIVLCFDHKVSTDVFASGTEYKFRRLSTQLVSLFADLPGRAKELTLLLPLRGDGLSYRRAPDAA